MSVTIKAALSKELALEAAMPSPDIGVRAGVDSWHPVHRGRPVIGFASWDLLDLHSRKEIQAGVSRLLHDGCGSSSVARLAGGLTASHLQCEQRMAQFFGHESATLFSTRNQAVLSVITALFGEGSVVIAPAVASLPLADACALAHAEYVEYDSSENIRALLERYSGTRRILVALESVSPITGEVVDIVELLHVVEQFGAWALVDETAAIGVMGMRGAASAELMPNHPALLCRLSSFTSLVGCELAGVVGPAELRDLLMRRSRYLRYDAPPQATAAQSVETALGLAELSIVAREKLATQARFVSQAIRTQGWRIQESVSSPIVALSFDSLRGAQSIQDALLQRGIYVDALAARGLRRNGAVVRILISARHSSEEVERLLEGLAEVRKRFHSQG